MAHESAVLERVQELTWEMVDNEISDDELRLLENLLLSDSQARSTYVDCIQLHTDLLAYYAKPADGATATTAPALSFLGGGLPPIDTQASMQ